LTSDVRSGWRHCSNLRRDRAAMSDKTDGERCDEFI
jgi:hypothetical protein